MVKQRAQKWSTKFVRHVKVARYDSKSPSRTFELMPLNAVRYLVLNVLALNNEGGDSALGYRPRYLIWYCLPLKYWQARPYHFKLSSYLCAGKIPGVEFSVFDALIIIPDIENHLRLGYSRLFQLEFRLFTHLQGAFVRPLLEYANQVVYLGRKKDVAFTERVQRAARKMVAGLKSVDYEARLVVPDLFPLECRRFCRDLILTHAPFEQASDLNLPALKVTVPDIVYECDPMARHLKLLCRTRKKHVYGINRSRLYDFKRKSNLASTTEEVLAPWQYPSPLTTMNGNEASLLDANFNFVIDELLRQTLESLQNPYVQIAVDENLVDLECADIIVSIFEKEEAQLFLDELTKSIPSFGVCFTQSV
ncbi:hypothetical protein CLF_109473 [Clonorchis sinensis]|uniref:Uncharacterized protein n=1 Tax=Clonorchis sinensis TaxID=79923 RepID=G7YJD5_CLOSI|nr:hypothetical protein CLF_109473 [Clonorchis sinensis]